MRSSRNAEPRLFRRIVVATDGSKDALKATKVAIELAKQLGAELIVANAVPFAIGVNGSSAEALGSVQALAEYHEFERTQARRIVKEATTLAKEQGVSARGVVLDRTASAVEMITKFGKEEQADLIVSGTRGLSGFKKLLVGSVSSGLVSHAPCSVLVVR